MSKPKISHHNSALVLILKIVAGSTLVLGSLTGMAAIAMESATVLALGVAAMLNCPFLLGFAAIVDGVSFLHAVAERDVLAAEKRAAA